MNARADMRSVLRDWIRKNGQDVDPALLTDTTPLIESGILDSLSIMELLLELERLRNAPVDVTRLQPGAFRSIDVIVRNFLEAA